MNGQLATELGLTVYYGPSTESAGSARMVCAAHEEVFENKMVAFAVHYASLTANLRIL